MPLSPSKYQSIKVSSVSGRYVHLGHIEPLLKKWSTTLSLEIAGTSVNKAPIYQLRLGKGKTRILMWSQMHGNEATTTRAVLDLVAYLRSGSRAASEILEACTLMIIPMLNPDGALAYTRVNAAGIDLNRDAQEQSQPESRVLRRVYESFQPHFCFNLHDQRSIFNVGRSDKPASLSFLAPAMDAARTVSPSRAASMRLIAAINLQLQGQIPGQVGRYDDQFNLQCVGDTFQALDTPTVLFEAGHFPGDYQREETRYFVFCALLASLRVLQRGGLAAYSVEDYFGIPENGKQFWDILVRNPVCLFPHWDEGVNLGIHYQEIREGEAVVFRPKLEEAGKLQDKFGHREMDCSRREDREEIQNNPALMMLLTGKSYSNT